jgi:signal transduction histidine kinase
VTANSGNRLRRGLAYVTSAERRIEPTRRAITFDVLLAVVGTVAVLSVGTRSAGPTMAFSIYQGDVLVAPAHQATTGATMVLLALTTVPLAFRRVRPLSAFWVIVVAAAATPHYAANLVTLAAVVFAAYSAVAYSGFRGAAILSMPAAGFLDVIYLHNNPSSSLPPAGTAILILFPVLIGGNTIGQLRRRASESKARLVQLQAEHEEATLQAIKQERARIASELHDVVTHSVSVMIVQAGAARQVLAESPAQAREALLAVESSGRAAMAELRNLLGLLAPVGEMSAPAASGASAVGDLQPQPGLSQLAALIDRVRSAGLPVELDSGALPQDMPPGVDLAAYRVVQEALTNVLKHAGKPSTTVKLDYHDGQLMVQVADAGRPMPAVGPAPVPGTGRGLLGLRERTELYGGELVAGPGPAGGWQVTARLPVTAQQPGSSPSRDSSPSPGGPLAPAGSPSPAEPPGSRERPEPAPAAIPAR